MPKFPRRKNVTVREIVFQHPVTRKLVPLMGSPRVAALRAFYRRQPIADGLEPVVLNPQQKIGHAEVAWQTAGSSVTED